MRNYHVRRFDLGCTGVSLHAVKRYPVALQRVLTILLGIRLFAGHGAAGRVGLGAA